MRVDLDGQAAHDVIMQTHQAFHFLHGRGGRVGAQVGIMPLAVFVDLERHRLDAPVFILDHFAAVVGQHGREMFDEAFGLRVGLVLTRNKHMLIKRHVNSCSFSRRIS